MATNNVKIEYIDTRDISIPYLTKYPNGIALSPNSKNKILEVTETEKVWLLRLKNGTNPCWKVIEDKPHRKEIKEEG